MGEINQFRIELGNRGAHGVPKRTATTSNHQKNHFLSAATVARTLLLVLPSKLDMRVRSPSPAPRGFCRKSNDVEHFSIHHESPRLTTTTRQCPAESVRSSPNRLTRCANRRAQNLRCTVGKVARHEHPDIGRLIHAVDPSSFDGATTTRRWDTTLAGRPYP